MASSRLAAFAFVTAACVASLRVHAQEVAPVIGPAPVAGGLESAAVIVSVTARSLPLLLPADPEARRATELVVGDHWYASTTRIDGLVVVLHALAADAVHIGLRDEVDAAGGLDLLRIHASHGIWSASFEYRGVAFVLDVECEAGPSDARCTSDAEVRRWSSDLRPLAVLP